MDKLKIVDIKVLNEIKTQVGVAIQQACDLVQRGYCGLPRAYYLTYCEGKFSVLHKPQIKDWPKITTFTEDDLKRNPTGRILDRAVIKAAIFLEKTGLHKRFGATNEKKQMKLFVGEKQR